jgi:ppGpp synthetase/RelA/SpoT-type nucleotidyltranferase
MKVDRTIRDAYAEQFRLNSLLRGEVDAVSEGIDSRWHYECRLKSEESFALKVEAGRCDARLRVEDFLGCTIVVQNATQIASAQEFVASSFDVKYQRPEHASVTSRRPTDFAFDDLRVYATAKGVDYVRTKEYADVVFEIQIKTFLQHAWSVATHDLTYKGHAINWAKVRIAHEIRAMLEHAELSIEQVDRLADSKSISREYAEYSRVTEIIGLIREHWTQEQLPNDLLRLARNIDRALGMMKISVSELDAALREEGHQGRGAGLVNLSPYGALMQTVVNRFPERLLRTRKGRAEPITISSQIDLPKEIGTLNVKYFRVI